MPQQKGTEAAPASCRHGDNQARQRRLKPAAAGDAVEGVPGKLYEMMRTGR